MTTTNPTKTTPASPPIELATRSQLSRRYGVSLRTVDSWRSCGAIPHFRMPGGRLVRFPIHACDEIILSAIEPHPSKTAIAEAKPTGNNSNN